jgi:uncharacterized protein
MTPKARTIESLTLVAAEDWNRCARSASSVYNPFVSHEFLLALEQSGSATAETGWSAQHLILELENRIIAVAPCYLKTHSQGEYVFDHGWADAFHRAGGHYYPKLQVSVPFTPVTGPRLLTMDPAYQATLADSLLQLCQKLHGSSVHMTFALPTEVQNVASPQWLQREDIQFHWKNPGYETYDAFLASLASSKRKNLRKERQAVRDLNITFEHVTGSALTENHWDHFFAFYMDTGSRKWGHPYLTRAFFGMIGQTMADAVLLVMAKRNNKYIAGALNLIGGDTLYGRNWGCIEHHPFLHFETCYYQAQDFAIARGLKTVEAGAQGEHKLARGYVPVKTQSLHHLSHPGLHRAVADYLKNERLAVTRDESALSQHTPYRKQARDGGQQDDL